MTVGQSADVHRSLVIKRSRVTVGAAGAVAATAVLVFFFGRAVGFVRLGERLEGASWGWLLFCVAGQVGVFAGYAGAFRSAMAFESGPEVDVRLSIRIALAGFGLTQIVAAGGAAGLAFTYWVLRHLGMPRRAAATRLIAMNTAVYLVFAVIAAGAALPGLGVSSIPKGMAVPWLVTVPTVLLLARWFTQPSRVDAWVQPAGGWLRNSLSIGVSAAAWARRAISDVEGRRVMWWAALYWIGDMISLWAALRSFGAAPSPLALILAYSTGYLAQAVPVPLVATGGVDAATTATLAAVGVPLEVALLGVVAHRVFAFWLPIGAGLGSAIALSRDPRLMGSVDVNGA